MQNVLKNHCHLYNNKSGPITTSKAIIRDLRGFNVDSLEKFSLDLLKINSIESDAFDFFRNLKELNLAANNLPFLNFSLFNENLKTLRKLNLTGVNRIDVSIFGEHLSNLEELILDCNKLENDFNSLANLRSLCCFSCRLTENRVTANMFKKLSRVEEIFLTDTALTHIDENAFACLTKLKVVSLADTGILSAKHLKLANSYAQILITDFEHMMWRFSKV